MQGRKPYGKNNAEKDIIVYMKRLRNIHHGKRNTYERVARILNADVVKYPPPRGKQWYATSIKNIILRNQHIEKHKNVKKLGVGESDYLNVRQASGLFANSKGMIQYGTLRQKRAGRIVIVLLLTGIRRQELCDLRIKDLPVIHGKNGITVRGKGNTLGTVSITPWLRGFLDDLCGRRRAGFVFKNESGRKYDARSINVMLTGVGRKTNLPFLRPHILRHTYASILVWNGCDIAFVKNQLRHASIASTNVYTDMLTERLTDTPPAHIVDFLKAINPKHPANADKI